MISNAPESLEIEFFKLFARWEYALKASGYHCSTRGFLQSDWEKFADDNSACFDSRAAIRSKELADAIDYLDAEPPLVQVAHPNHTLGWAPYRTRPNDSKLKQLLRVAHHVRNNLFHGGKAYPNPSSSNRDEKLLRCAIEVIHECIRLHQLVDSNFHH